jgi:hypothetical protein
MRLQLGQKNIQYVKLFTSAAIHLSLHSTEHDSLKKLFKIN